MMCWFTDSARQILRKRSGAMARLNKFDSHTAANEPPCHSAARNFLVGMDAPKPPPRQKLRNTGRTNGCPTKNKSPAISI